MISFQAALFRPDAPGTWTYAEVPFSVEEAFGTKGRVPVKGEINGVSFSSSLMALGKGRHMLVVNGDIRQAIRAEAGDVVDIRLERDDAKREVTVPDDLNAALNGHEQARLTFERMSYSHRKEYVDWIEGAKKPETRSSRIEKALERLAEGRGLKQ